MAIPLDKLVSTHENMYLFTVASIRRAKQITMTGDEDIDNFDGKVVSTALTQMLTKQVEYKVEK